MRSCLMGLLRSKAIAWGADVGAANSGPMPVITSGTTITGCTLANLPCISAYGFSMARIWRIVVMAGSNVLLKTPEPSALKTGPTTGTATERDDGDMALRLALVAMAADTTSSLTA